MEKNNKKKIAGGAAAVAAATGATVILSQDGENEESAVAAAETIAEGEAVLEGEPIAEGEELPELVVTGESHIVDGESIPEVVINGNSQATETATSPNATEVETADNHVASPTEIVEPQQLEEPSAVSSIPEQKEEECPEIEIDPDEGEGLLGQMGNALADGMKTIEDSLNRAFGDGVDEEQPMMPDFVNNADTTGF